MILLQNYPLTINKLQSHLQITYKSMLTFEPCIRSLRNDGYAKVYIRVIKDGNPAYIHTDYLVSSKQLNGNKIKDTFILTETMLVIRKYIEKMNKTNSKNWTVKDISTYLQNVSEEISFTDYYQRYINDMVNSGREVPSVNYKYAMRSFKAFCGKDNINFSDVTSQRLNGWILTLMNTKRAKNMYPTCIRTVFTAGLVKYNDYDNDDIRIKNLPFMRVIVPRGDKAKKRSTTKETLLKLFNADFSDSKLLRTERAKDVGLLIFCLAGINVSDLYYMDKDCRVGNKLCYNRHKTMIKREDDAYTEITIPDRILYLFDKYKGVKRLLSFSDTITLEKTLTDEVDRGLKDVAKKAGVTSNITSYTFRHSYGTIAQNFCGASTEMVGFSLNHASSHRVTEGYIEKDYTPIDTLNNKVLEYVFGKSDATIIENADYQI